MSMIARVRPAPPVARLLMVGAVLAAGCVAHGATAQSSTWTATNFPTPTDDAGFEMCGLTERGLVCDVDRVLSDEERVELNNRLFAFHNNTYDPEAETPCKRKGTTVAIAIVRNLGADMLEQRQLSTLTVQLHARWHLDPECSKSFVILLPVHMWKLITRDFYYEAPVFYDEFTFYFFREHEAFQNDEYFKALTNIVDGMQTAVLLKRQLTEPVAHATSFSTSIKQMMVRPMFVLTVMVVTLVCFALVTTVYHLASYACERSRFRKSYIVDEKSGNYQGGGGGGTHRQMSVDAATTVTDSSRVALTGGGGRLGGKAGGVAVV